MELPLFVDFLCCYVGSVVSVVAECLLLAGFLLGFLFDPENGGNMLFRNIG
jgi:hypothetical protein